MKLLNSLLALLFFAPSVAFASSEAFMQVEQEVRLVEQNLNAQVGVAILNTETGENWDHNGNERFPLTSTFKTIACAKLLYDFDKGKVPLDAKVQVKSTDLVTYSPIIEKHVGSEITLTDACHAAMTMSDNTAANIIIKAVGGTQSITNFVKNIGDTQTRLDRMEPDLNEGALNDPRDTTTPTAITNTLNELLFGSTLSDTSKEQLKEWMVNNQVTGNLLRSVLPNDLKIADRSGAGGFGARSITAIVWNDQRAPIIISIYIAQTDASMEQRNAAIVNIGRVIFGSYVAKLH
ncbi:CARB/PSE/RTG family carbenicillin-hydrolyzing class A beta-lactamase [Vibrio sp. CK2-1]|uniref:CARB/PSE/RTG family carbenicillin-hydrolyzing class A beta-lactamase n=1 Tax=Vibrio sp. CK2-1 TaxID=2912249 RepID=UPI001EFF3C84|nr:CARB/PSE/RTG family carbenicillin-hydrolyzing class A beta-lactamase [Vibrio sp. CK2-1]MCF7354638.1 CARB/PSE/RTG family carbenicillin-hydrolyzing class A beta-lactamase [Vibrio sp. CK2-1]